MQIVMFYHSLLSDWNHGNAHFLRGIVSDLQQRGHHVRVFEPRNNWSLSHQLTDHGTKPLIDFRRVYPGLESIFYDLETLNLYEAVGDADLVIVHEWNDPRLVSLLGQQRAAGATYRLLFHDTHHRSVTDPKSIQQYDLSAYDGVLAFGNAVRDEYLRHGWSRAAWTWHEAADTRVFQPRRHHRPDGDLVWIGNWGDDERTQQLHEFLLGPVKKLNLRAKVYGVRYPDSAVRDLHAAGIEYGGWLPNYAAPEVFGRYRVTVHVPRQAYAEALPGIPTIRVFEALACGIPLICAPWDDIENLFTPGADYLTARDGAEAAEQISRVLRDETLANSLSTHGRRTILNRHCCSHRVDELFAICRELGMTAPSQPIRSTISPRNQRKELA